MSSPVVPGRLLLVPTPLDFGCEPPSPLSAVLPAATLEAAAQTRHWITENAKSTRAFLKRVAQCQPLVAPLQAHTVTELPRAVHKHGDHQWGFDARPLLGAALQGHDIALVSEAGMPAVADPGSSVVRAAHALNLVVLPLVGPVSLLLALAASGLNGQQFAFVGYLPQAAPERAAALRDLERKAVHSGQTQMWIETPYRNPAMFSAALQVLQSGTRLAVASGLTLAQQRIHCRTVAQWKTAGDGPDARTPAVYALGP